MSTSILVSVLIVAGFLLKGAIGRIRGQLEAHRRKLTDLATSKGWQCQVERMTGFYTMSGTTEGVSWQLEFGREGKNTKTAPSLRWHCDGVGFDGAVIAIRTRRTFDMLSGRFGKFLIKISVNAASQAASQQASLINDLLQNGKQITPPSSALGMKYAVLVKPDAGLDEFVSADLERALDAWGTVPTRGSYGDTLGVDVGPNVRVYCSFAVPPEHLEKFVDIGVQVVNAVRQRSTL